MSEKTLEELYRKLEEYSDFEQDESNTERFLNIIESILSHKDPASIPIILKYFDDGSEYSWVFQNIIHGLESFDDETYVKSILKNLDVLIPDAIEWASELVVRILNNPNCQQIIKNYDKEFFSQTNIQETLEKIKERFPRHQKLISELHKELHPL